MKKLQRILLKIWMEKHLNVVQHDGISIDFSNDITYDATNPQSALPYGKRQKSFG